MSTLAVRIVAAVLFCLAWTPSRAVEGSSAAGPIGGTDIRSALLPPPGVYGGTIQLYAEAHQFFDGEGHLVPALNALDLARTRAGPFMLLVPDLQVFGGSLGLFAIAPGGTECGRLFITTPKRCVSGIGDPYVEAGWSRFFGTMRASRDKGAFPIPEGLTVSLSFGTVFPLGRYDAFDATTQGLVIGNNLWDFAPIVALTYVTPPLLAEGTELSAKIYWNNYSINPDTQYQTGDLIDVDFAVSERIGRVQAGLAGYYIRQIEDDTQFGVRVPPDGRRAETLALGGVIAYDIAESAASLKLKVLTSVLERNTVRSPFGVAIGWARKF